MNLTKLSAIAEIVSSVAILVTLGYLALEMRQNTIAIQGTIRQSMLAEDRELLFKQIDVPAIRIASSDPSGLTDEELLQFNGCSTKVVSSTKQLGEPTRRLFWVHCRRRTSETGGIVQPQAYSTKNLLST